MNQQRVKQIIAAYGGNAARWPEAERVAALKLCQSAPELAVLQREQAGLDQLLDSQHVATQCSATEVLAQLVIATELVQMPALNFWNRIALWLLPWALWTPVLSHPTLYLQSNRPLLCSWGAGCFVAAASGPLSPTASWTPVLGHPTLYLQSSRP